MALSSISSAVQIPSSQPFYHAVFAATSASIQRLFTGVSTQFEGVSLFHLPYASAATGRLVNRVLVLSALTLSLTTFFLEYLTFPPEKRWQSITNLFRNTVWIMIGNFGGFWFMTSCEVLRGLIHLKNTYFAPLNDQPDILSRTHRAFQVVYIGLKYLFLAAVAGATCLACYKNIFNGVLFWAITRILSVVFSPAVIAMDPEENEMGRWMGAYLAFNSLRGAVVTGMGGAIFLRNWPSLIAGIQTRNLQSFLSGLRGISHGFFAGYVFKTLVELHRLDQACFQIAARCNLIVAKAREDSLARQVELSGSHFEKSIDLAFSYFYKKTDPQKREKIIEQLKDLDPIERELVFLEHQPFLDPEETQEFIQICELQSTQLCRILSPDQIGQFVFPSIIASQLNPEGLNHISGELDDLEKEILTICSSFWDDQELQKKYKKFIEYRSAMLAVADVLQSMHLQSLRHPETQRYFERLQELLPQILVLKERIIRIEAKMEQEAPDLTQSPTEALGEMKGLRDKDSREILIALQRDISMVPLRDLEQLLDEKGIKNKADLIMKGILQKQDNLKGLKSCLIAFLLPPSELNAPVSSLSERAAQLAFKIYQYVAHPFFVALQLYLQPRWVVAGLLCGVIGVWRFSDTRIYELFMTIMCLSTPSILHRRVGLIFVETFLQSQLVLACSGRGGFIPALLCGAYQPFYLLARYGRLLEQFRSA